MHFECSDQLIRKWATQGALGAPASSAAAQTLLSLGDRGPAVIKLQTALNANGEHLFVDGDFGRNTQAAVMRFQAAHTLTPDGVVGSATLAALHLVL